MNQTSFKNTTRAINQVKVKPASLSSSGVSPYAFLVGTANGTNSSGTTTSPINTTGATLIVLVVTGNYIQPQDIYGNGFILATSYNNPSASHVSVYYCFNPVGGPAHTWTVSGTSSFSSILAMAFTGGPSNAICTAYNGSISSHSPGAITTPSPNNLIITAIAEAPPQTDTAVTGGFTITNTLTGVSAQYYSVSAAYLNQIAPSTVPSPTWSGGSGLVSSAIVSFGQAPTTAVQLPTGNWNPKVQPTVRYTYNPQTQLGKYPSYNDLQGALDPNMMTNQDSTGTWGPPGSTILMFCSYQNGVPATPGRISMGLFTANPNAPFVLKNQGRILNYNPSISWESYSGAQNGVRHCSTVWNPDTNLYHHYYSCYNPGKIGVAFSTNGLAPTRYPGNPILYPGMGGDSGETDNFTLAAFRISTGNWFGIYGYNTSTATEPGYRAATSTDGITWTKTGTGDVITAPAGLFIEQHQVFFALGQWWLIYEQWNNGNTVHIHLAWSPSGNPTGPYVDYPGVTNPIFGPATNGWDQGNVATPGVYPASNPQILLYTGAQVGLLPTDNLWNVGSVNMGMTAATTQNLSAPTISGTATHGDTLTCSPGIWWNNSTYSYQWVNSSTGNIIGATSSTYVVQVSDEGATLTCVVTSNGVSATSAPTSTVN